MNHGANAIAILRLMAKDHCRLCDVIASIRRPLPYRMQRANHKNCQIAVAREFVAMLDAEKAREEKARRFKFLAEIAKMSDPKYRKLSNSHEY